MTDVRAKLAELGLTLPVAAKPVAAYVPAIQKNRYLLLQMRNRCMWFPKQKKTIE